MTESLTAADGQLADPLEQFWAQDPTVLHDPTQAAAAEPDPHRRIALELAAAIVVAVVLVRRRLAAQEPDVGHTDEQARRAWNRVVPAWMRLAVPAIAQAYRLGRVEGLTEDELQLLAHDYAAQMGEYVNTTSAEALAEGMDAQLAKRWDRSVAWHRARAAYGLDRRDMHGYLAGLMRSEKSERPELIPLAARTLADKAMLRRADQMGENESWTATQTGQALAWLWLQRSGRLPAGAQREWDVDESEGTCQTCRELHQQQVGLDEPFVTTDGQKLWAPQAHPRCHCNVRLRLPEGLAKARAGDPYDRDRRGHFASRESRTTYAEPPAPVTERPAADPLARTGDPLARTANPFATDPFARAVDPLRTNPFRRSPTRNPFARETSRPRPRKLVRTIVLLPDVPKPPPSPRPYYLPVDDFHVLTDSHSVGAKYDLGEMVDFTWAASRPIAQAGASPWNLLTDSHIFIPTRVPMYMTRDEVHRLWGDIVPKAWTGWNNAVNNADTIVEKLDAGDLGAIAHIAGYETDEDPESMRSRISAAVLGMGTGDNSLANAYADYVTWHSPGVFLGQTGKRIEEALDAAEDAGLSVRDLIDEPFPTEQVFAFERGLHPGTISDDSEALLHGAYVPTYSRYRSALHDLGLATPPLRFGLHEAYVEPFAEEGGIWIPKGTGHWTSGLRAIEPPRDE